MRSPRRLFWLFTMAAIALLLISMVDARGFRRYLRLRREIAALGEKRHRLAEENRALRLEVRSLREDPEAIEQAAREQLGYIKPGELIFNLE